MIGRIARKEFTEMVRDGRFRVAATVVLVLTAAALLVGWRHAERVAAEHEAAQRATRAQWLNQPAKNPHSAAHYGVYAFKPQTPLAAVDPGVDPYVGVAAWLEAHRQNEFRFRPAADRASVQRFGDLTAAFVVHTLLPLVIVLLAFGALATEREQGTWRQLASLGVPPRVLVAGKAAGVGGAIAIIVIPAVGLAALAVSWSSVTEVWESDGLRMLTLAAVYLAWTALWVLGTLVVSAASPSSRAALISLVAIWIVTTLIVPRLVSEASARAHPTPSAAQFQRELDQALAVRAPVEERLRERRSELYAKYGVSRDQDLPINFAGISLQEGEEHGNEVFDQQFGRLWDAFERQNRLAQFAGLVTPAVAVRSLSMGLSGSDFAQYRHFATAAEQYRRQIQRILNGKVAEHRLAQGEVYLAGSDVWALVPDFNYTAPSLGWVLSNQAPSLVILGGWLIVLAGLSLFAIRHAKPLA
jgi:ABC-2 type transport system permease protein